MSEGGMGREERESRLRYLRMRFLVRLLAIFKILAEESGEPRCLKKKERRKRRRERVNFFSPSLDTVIRGARYLTPDDRK